MKIGIDLGGTKTELIVLNHEGMELYRERRPTPQGQYDEMIEVIALLVELAKKQFSLDRDHPVGIGTPGALTFVEGQWLMKNCNSTALNGRPLMRDLEKRLHCPVVIANDANCFALAEALSGAGIKHEHSTEKANQSDMPGARSNVVFGVILGTGVGGGLVVNGQVLTGPNSIAGEWGHNILPLNAMATLGESETGRACYCGRNDCIETYLSGPGLSESYRLRYGAELNAKEIVAAMRQGDLKANDIWQSYLDQLARSLAQVINIVDPELIVLGGGLSLIDEIYTALPGLLKPHVFTDQFNTPVVPAKLGDSAGVFGAAWLCT